MTAFAIVFLSACAPEVYSESEAESIKTMQAYKIYMTGNYTSVNDECSQTFLSLSATQVNDSEIMCDIGNVKLVEAGAFVLEGKNCSAEGHELSSFSFSITNNKDGTITYKNSGETVWQQLKKCPQE